MLDKSIPYKHIIMKLDRDKICSDEGLSLPPGFSFAFYKEGYEEYWADNETAVLEFAAREDALSYFKKELIPFAGQLKERMVFILNSKGIPIANTCAWYTDHKGRHQAHIHYVAVRPEYQGLGLGRAVFQKALSLFPVYEPGEDVYLHTQTWSHVAIRMYLKFGFRMIKDDTLGYRENQYEEAVDILAGLYDEDLMRLVREKRDQEWR